MFRHNNNNDTLSCPICGTDLNQQTETHDLYMPDKMYQEVCLPCYLLHTCDLCSDYVGDTEGEYSYDNKGRQIVICGDCMAWCKVADAITATEEEYK